MKLKDLNEATRLQQLRHDLFELKNRFGDVVWLGMAQSGRWGVSREEDAQLIKIEDGQFRTALRGFLQEQWEKTTTRLAELGVEVGNG